MSDNRKPDEPEMHLIGHGVWLPDDIADLVQQLAETFFQDQKDNDIETIERNAELFIDNTLQQTGDQWQKVRETLKELIDDRLGVMRIAAIFDGLKPYLIIELQKPLYKGMSLHDMVEAYKKAESRAGGDYYYRLYQFAMSRAMLARELDQLQPYITAELKKPAYKGKTLDDVRRESIEYSDPLDPLTERIRAGSLFSILLQSVREAQNRQQIKDSAEHITSIETDKVEYPVDKINSNIWNLLKQDTQGQIVFNLAKEKDKGKKNVTATYAINFDELGEDIKITKQLMPFDKRVYLAINALFNAGNKVITLTQISYMMGNTARPGRDQLAKINDSITKMTRARIYVNNSVEAAAYKYPSFIYDGSLLPFERYTGVVNGQLADAAIHIFREPPLITFAKQRGQITTINVSLLQSPVSKTDANILIDDYLIERISREKAIDGKRKVKKHSCKMLYKTLYERTNVMTKKQKQRAPEKISRYLTHYQKEGFIKRFTMENDSLTVFW